MTTIVADTLRLGHGFAADERDHVVELLGRLDERLRSFSANHIELEIAVKERDTASQRTTLEAKLGGMRRLVASSDHEAIDGAVLEVREDLIRQISDLKHRSEPKNNHQLR